jgi:uncharacterized protein YkwD
MLFRIRTLVAAASTTLVVCCAAVPSAHAGMRRQMVRAINYMRSWHNRRQVRYSPQLSSAAAAWARRLVERDTVQHAQLHGHEGEIIEWHTGADAQVASTVDEWSRSSPHRHVMLGKGYTVAGAGRAVGYMDGQQCTIWVVRFAG